MTGLAEILAWPHDTGVAGSAIVTAVLGIPAYVHSHLKSSRHHKALLAQRERHHLDAKAQAQANHNALMLRADRRHEQQLAATESQTEELKAHITAQRAGPAVSLSPEQAATLADGLARRSRQRGERP